MEGRGGPRSEGTSALLWNPFLSLIPRSKEAPLPHSARVISFLNPDTACFAYSPTEYAVFSLSTMSAVDIITPLPTTTSAGVGAMGALSGLTGYMTLGLGAKPKPTAVHTGKSEVLITKDSECAVYSTLSNAC